MDIDEIVRPEETYDVHLKHPGSGDDIGVVIAVYGMDSEAYRATSHEQRARRVKAMKPGKIKMIPDDLERDALELLAACTAGWNTMTVKGENLPFNKANALRVYRDYPWIREQVDEAIADRANFTKES